MLRYAQHDRAVTPTDAWTILLNCIIGHIADYAVSKNNPDKGMPTEADNAHEHMDPGSRMGHSPVMLSAAKHLDAHRDRPFASLRVTVLGPISSSGLFFEPA